MSSKHHFVVFANFARDNGFTLKEAVDYAGANYDDLPAYICEAYEDFAEELSEYVEDYIREQQAS
jgi:hypothetical protein